MVQDLNRYGETVTVRFPNAIIAALDRARGDVPRATYLRAVLLGEAPLLHVEER